MVMASPQFLGLWDPFQMGFLWLIKKGLVPGKVQVLEFALIFGIFTDLALSMEKVTDDDFARSTNRSKILGNVGSWDIIIYKAITSTRTFFSCKNAME